MTKEIARIPAEVRLVGLHETLAAGMTDEMRFRELIDNALEGTAPSEAAVVSITINLRHNCLTINNTPAKPMTQEELLLLGTLGRNPQERKRGHVSGEHGMGGTIALSAYADKEFGTFNLTSPYAGPDYTGYIRYTRPNWLTRLHETTAAIADTGPVTPTTTVTLEGLSQTAQQINPYRVADYLGIAYAPLLTDGKLTLRLYYQGLKSHTQQAILIEPLVIPFGNDTKQSGRLSASPKGQGPFLHITTGDVDTSLTDGRESQRDTLYGKTNRHPDTSLYARGVFVYVGGRLAFTTTLDKLKVPYATAKRSLDNMCTVVHIDLDPRVKLSPHKDGLDTTDPTSEALIRRIQSWLEPIVKQRVETRRDTEENLTQRYHRVLEQTHDTMVAALQQMVPPTEFAKRFKLAGSFLSHTPHPDLSLGAIQAKTLPEKGKRRDTPVGKVTTIPGLHPSRGPRAVSSIQESGSTLYEITLAYPLPPLVVDRLDTPFPARVEVRNLQGAEDLPVTILNIDHPLIREALAKSDKDQLSRNVLIEKVLEALFEHSGSYNRTEFYQLVYQLLEKAKK